MMHNLVNLWIKHKVKTPFKAMWGGGSKFFLHFLDFLFCYVFETNLHFIYLGPSRTLTASGIVLSVTLFSGFRKILILDVIVRTPPPFIKGQWDFSKMALMGGWKIFTRNGGEPGMGGRWFYEGIGNF